MDILERQALLKTDRNPDTKLDYVSSLNARIDLGQNGILNVALRYVPDRLILCPDTFSLYLEALSDIEWNSLEKVAAVILNDVNNVLIARWVQLSVTSPQNKGEAGVDHAVLLEDRQPNWDNPSLLSRLNAY